MDLEEEMVGMDTLSGLPEPDIDGTLVGPRLLSHAITAEYAQGDSIYVRKTTALPQRFSHYRKIKGDGTCGWRALAYGYFEALIRSGDPAKFRAEKARLEAFHPLFDAAKMYWKDFAEETHLLLTRTAANLHSQDEESALLASFNEPYVSSAIIVYFKLITAVWMRAHEAEYQPWLPDKTVDQYCNLSIIPFAVEIEHYSMDALIKAIMYPAGISVDVLYLDRSNSEEANEFHWAPPIPGGGIESLDGGTIRLLYRPGHYDMLYKLEDIPENVNLQVQSMSSYSSFTAEPTFDYALGGIDIDSMMSWNIPGASYFPVDENNAYASEDFTRALAPTVSTPASDYNPTDTPRTPNNFRRSIYMSPEYNQSPGPIEPCQTEPMKRAGETPAHFRNENFQPEIWEPGFDYRSGESQSRRSP